MEIRKFRIGFVFLAIALAIASVMATKKKQAAPPPKKAPAQIRTIVSLTSISPCADEYKSVQHINSQLQRWREQAPEITEVGTYGKTSKGTPCNYFRIGTKDKPKILIHSGLCGDEEFPVIANMQLIHRLLSDYQADEEVTWLVENRDIYFIPVVSPDTYLQTRKIENIDPQTNFPSYKRMNPQPPSATLVLMQWASQQKFKGVLNNHAPGEKLLPPEICKAQDYEAICGLIDKMTGRNGYITSRVDKSDGTGNDVDWFYTTGACSMSMFWGKNSQQTVCYKEVAHEVERNYPALKLFIKEAAEMELQPRPLKTIYFYQAD